MINYGPEPFLSDYPVDELTVSSKFCRFAVCPFVVLLFCDRDRRTSKFQFFEFETRPPMIATIAMATRMAQPECAIEARRVSQLFGCAIQARGSRNDEKAFCVNSSTNKNGRFVSIVRKIRGQFFFRISNETKSNVQTRSARQWWTLESSYRETQ